LRTELAPARQGALEGPDRAFAVVVAPGADERGHSICREGDGAEAAWTCLVARSQFRSLLDERLDRSPVANPRFPDARERGLGVAALAVRAARPGWVCPTAKADQDEHRAGGMGAGEREGLPQVRSLPRIAERGGEARIRSIRELRQPELDTAAP